MKFNWITCLIVMVIATISRAQQPSVIKEIQIRGSINVSKEAIGVTMRTKVGQPYVQENLDADRIAIDAMGFFSAVDVRAVPLEGGAWQVLVDVKEFFRIKEFRVTGNTSISTDKILDAVTLKPGDVFNLNQLKPSSDAIQKLYSSQGFFIAIENFGPQDASPETVELTILETTVGSITLKGNDRTRSSVIRKMINTKPGVTYNSTKWTNDFRRLFGTRWFEEVLPGASPGSDAGKVDLSLDFKETQTGQFNVGIQLDPQSSLAGLIKLSETNLFGTGQSVSIDYLQATRGGGPSIDLSYGNPFIDNRRTNLSTSLYSRVVYRFSSNLFGGSSNNSSTGADYFERRTGASLGLSRAIDDYTSGSISFRAEQVKTEDLNTNSTATRFRQDGTLSVLTFGLTKDRRDVPFDAAEGDWTRIELEPGYSKITKEEGFNEGLDKKGGQFFGRTTLEYRKYIAPGQAPRGRNLSEARRVIAMRARAGAISGDVPFFEQYFVGGTNTVRGYEEDRFWGNQMLALTVEYRNPVPGSESLSLIGFVDYGGAWGGYGQVGNFAQSNKFRMNLGFGVGVSFRVDFLGSVRLDLGFNESGKSRTHFVIGSSF